MVSESLKLNFFQDLETLVYYTTWNRNKPPAFNPALFVLHIFF